MPTIGILFDIEGLGGGLYGYSAYKALFAALDTRLIPSSVLADGDTSATLAGNANHYCIAVTTSDPAAIGRVRDALSRSSAEGLLPLGRRFLEGGAVDREPLVPAAQVDGRGVLVGAKPRWIAEAWEAAQKSRADSVPLPMPDGPPPATAPLARSVPSAVPFEGVFDVQRFGLNLWVGLALMLAFAFDDFSWMVPALAKGQSVGLNPPGYYLINFCISLLDAGVFVVAVHHIHRVAPLVAFWSGFALVRGVLWRAVFALVPVLPGGGPKLGLFEPALLVRSIVYGAAFMLILILAVRTWKLTLTAFLAGGVVATLLPPLLLSWSAFLRPDGFRWSSIATIVVNGLVLGGLLYAAVRIHLRGRGVGRSAAVADDGMSTVSRASAATGTKTGASSGTSTYYYICSGNRSLINAFAEVFSVAEQAGWGKVRRAMLDLADGSVTAARQSAAARGERFDGDQFLGDDREGVERMDDLLARMEAAGVGVVHVLIAEMNDAHASWVRTAYNTLLQDAVKQGILPFRMFTTRNATAAEALANLMRRA